ncbi:cell division protein DivIC [Halalkalibacter hemicellulosilyticusJCM 9152]|uniref:Cell division protein DivIC n=1 Tax=Halalkalibacter hemicellulosilyticusJCM 9152 TaxID=1236971 RepID=W4QCB0_9BACI|nr:cell division protein DivIC [Halalkalibacter hemicellulosilyticusJCM 9152]
MPTKRLLFFFIVISVIFVILGFFGVSWVWIIIGNGVVLLISLLDLLLSPNRKELNVSRQLDGELERGIAYQGKVVITNRSHYSVTVRIIDDLPQSFVRPFPIELQADSKSASSISYETVAPVRGKYLVKKLYIRYKSVYGLWEKQMAQVIEDEVKVIPDLTDTRHFLENAQKFLLHEGKDIRKRRSDVGEFAQIRNYVVGDDPRKINWRQTAKLQELMTNEYEPEHGKHVTLLIDCGRMMGAELKKGNRLERSLEAAITVAAASLQKGDQVAVLAFSSQVKVFVPPAKGMAHLQTILQAIYDVKVDGVESNYADVLRYLETVQKKRSLLLLFSDVRTFLHEESALVYLQRLRQRHLFFMIGVEDEMLKSRVGDDPEEVRTAVVKAMAMKQILVKKREKAKWERQGLHMIEAEEERLTVAAVSTYFDVMNRGLL